MVLSNVVDWCCG